MIPNYFCSLRCLNTLSNFRPEAFFVLHWLAVFLDQVDLHVTILYLPLYFSPDKYPATSTYLTHASEGGVKYLRSSANHCSYVSFGFTHRTADIPSKIHFAFFTKSSLLASASLMKKFRKPALSA